MAKRDLIYPELMQYIHSGILDFARIPDDRLEILNSFTSYLKSKNGKTINLIFICTHNSRRSHLSQIWAQVAAAYYGIPEVHTFSGGTEATAFNERAVAAMQRAGFSIRGNSRGNPHYEVRYGDSFPSLEAFSKTFDDPFNPQKDFAAIMTCSHAEEACPLVPGAERRISLHYDDPKDFDGTEQESAKYDERCEQIARELFFVMSRV
ncbi:MAG: low molecular weight phosphatase family protein [Bacteroidota bacterium]